MNMVTVKPDNEYQPCWVCGGPRVRPFPCHRGCAERGGMRALRELYQECRAQRERAVLDMLRHGVGLPIMHPSSGAEAVKWGANDQELEGADGVAWEHAELEALSRQFKAGSATSSKGAP